MAENGFQANRPIRFAVHSAEALLIKARVVTFFLLWLSMVQVCDAGKLKTDKVESLKLDPKVEATDHAYFAGLESISERNDGVGRSAVLALPFMYVEEGDPSKTLTEFLKAQQIDVPSIIFAEIESQLKAGPLAAKLSDSSENTLKVWVDAYGLSKGGGTDRHMRPYAFVRMTLADGTGKELWKSKGTSVGGADFSLPQKSLHEWMADPAAMKAAYVEAAKLLAKKLLPSPAPKKKKSHA